MNISKNIARLNTGVITHYGVSISEYLNYQSIELAKSLLLFSHTERLYKWDEKSIGYLKAYGANCFGNKLDKASWKSRSKWVDDNLDKIVNFRNGELIVKGLKERENVIVPTDRILNILDKDTKIKPLSRRLPIIVKPNNYTRVVNENGVKERLGSYLLNDSKFLEPLMIPKWNFAKPTLIQDDNLVYDLVNNINSVAFKINTDVFNFISVYGTRYDLVIDFSYVHPLSTKEKLTKQEFIDLSSFLSKKNLQDNILSIADIFSNVAEFFLPTRLDFRGREITVNFS